MNNLFQWHGWEMERTKGRSLVNKTSEGLDLEGSKRALVDRAVGAWTCVKERLFQLLFTRFTH